MVYRTEDEVRNAAGGILCFTTTEPDGSISNVVMKNIVLKRDSRLHYKAFVDELNRHMKTDFTIPLPIDENDKIAWDYMDSYMRNIEAQCQTNINALIDINLT